MKFKTNLVVEEKELPFVVYIDNNNSLILKPFSEVLILEKFYRRHYGKAGVGVLYTKLSHTHAIREETGVLSVIMVNDIVYIPK